jgi:hypothetical protein
LSPESQDHLISTFLEFGGREFSVVVTHDGYSHWFEISMMADYRHILFTASLDRNDAKLLSMLESEYTLKTVVPEDGLRVIREELAPQYWAETPAADKILDAILEPIFWRAINPQLSPPIHA